MIDQIKFKEDYRVFKKDDTINFKNGINVLCGDQGCRKSTLLNLLRQNGNIENKQLISIQAPNLLELVDNIYCLEYRKWMSCEELNQIYRNE